MGVSYELVDADGEVIALPDPAGSGYFNAAGDFDRLLDLASSSSGPLVTTGLYGTASFGSDDAPSLRAEVAVLQASARPGPELRGLQRLQALIDNCEPASGRSIRFIGD